MPANIQYVGGVTSGRAGSTGTTTQSINGTLTGGLASSPAQGDLVFITISAASGSSYAPTTLAVSGWTNGTFRSNTGVANYSYIQSSWKFMTSTPDTSITIPSSGNLRNAQRWTVHVFRGVNSTTPLDVTTVFASGTASGRPNPGAITPITTGAWILWTGASAAGTGTAYTAPTDFSTDWLGGTTADTYDTMIGAGYYTGWTASSYDPAAITAGGTTGATDSWVAETYALRPSDNALTPATPTDSFTVSDVLTSALQANSELTDTITNSEIIQLNPNLILPVTNLDSSRDDHIGGFSYQINTSSRIRRPSTFSMNPEFSPDFLWTAASGVAREYSHKAAQETISGMSERILLVRPDGIAAGASDDGSNRYIWRSESDIIKTSSGDYYGDLTLFLYNIARTYVSSLHGLVVRGTPTDTYHTQLGLNSTYNDTASSGAVSFLRTDNAGTPAGPHKLSVIDNKPHVWIGTRKAVPTSQLEMTLYRDGIRLDSDTVYRYPVATAPSTVTLYSVDWADSGLKSVNEVYIAAIWNRCLTTEELTFLSQNPWALFKYNKHKIRSFRTRSQFNYDELLTASDELSYELTVGGENLNLTDSLAVTDTQTVDLQALKTDALSATDQPAFNLNKGTITESAVLSDNLSLSPNKANNESFTSVDTSVFNANLARTESFITSDSLSTIVSPSVTESSTVSDSTFLNFIYNSAVENLSTTDSTLFNLSTYPVENLGVTDEITLDHQVFEPSILLRAVKGSALTSTEMDSNFSILNTRKLEQAISSVTTTSSVTLYSQSDILITALSETLSIDGNTTTSKNGRILVLRVKDDGTSRALSWDTSIRGIGLTLPTSTTPNKLYYFVFIFNSQDSKWDCLGYNI